MAVFVVRRADRVFFVLLMASFLIFVLVAIVRRPAGRPAHGHQSPNKRRRSTSGSSGCTSTSRYPQRYVTWLRGVVKCVVPGQQCDLGTTMRRPAGQSTCSARRSLSTLRLVTAATVLAIVLGVSIGIVSSLRQYSGFDYTITFSAFLFFSLPIFWVAVLLKQYLAIGVNNWYRSARSASVSRWSSRCSAPSPGGRSSVGTVGASGSSVAGGRSCSPLAILLYLSAVGLVHAPALGPFVDHRCCRSGSGWSWYRAGGGPATAATSSYACLVTAGVGSVSSVRRDAVARESPGGRRDRTSSCSWSSPWWRAASATSMGGLDRPQAVRACACSRPLLTGFLDHHRPAAQRRARRTPTP